jgi:hypothetical protein
MFKYKHLGFYAMLISLLSGCVPAATFRASPRFPEQAKLIHEIALLPADVKVYRIDAGGVREEISEWSSEARTNLLAAIDNVFRAKTTFSLRTIDDESLTEQRILLEDTRTLYAAVSMMILLHAYPNPNIPSLLFEEKLINFDYSLGKEIADLARDSDALLFLDAEDHVWTASRQALQAFGVILGIGAGVATGVVVIPQLGGGTVVRAALVDRRSGDILWINSVGMGAGKDLRDSASAADMINQLFKDFPMPYEPQAKDADSR